MTLDYSDKTILVLDDQKSFLAMLKSMLVSLGAKKVTAANHCEAAVALCQQTAFDIVLCDLHFGDNRKNGFEFLEEIKQKRLLPPHAVFILMSADAQRPMVLGSIEKFPDEYLVKPFSRALLDLRMSKQVAQKNALISVYQNIHQDQPEQAIEACKTLLQRKNRHKDMCLKLLIKLLWQTHQYQDAEQLLEALPQSANNHWLNVSRAQTQLLLKNYQAAIDIAKKVMVKNKLYVDAHDIISTAYLALGQKRDAFYAIESALYLSPHSVKRNLLACEIARENAEQSNLVHYTKHIWELTIHTVNFDVAHLCNHVRSHLDYAEQIPNKESKTKAQQNALKSLTQLSQQSAGKLKHYGFEPHIYQQLVESRVDFQNERLSESKRKLREVQQHLAAQGEHYPLVMLPDTIKAMYDHQEFDEAQQLLQTYQTQCVEADPNTAASLQAYTSQVVDTKEQYVKHNSQAIVLFEQGEFEAALNVFKRAQKIAPNNSAIALNLLKCQLKLLERTKRPAKALVNACQANYRRLTTMPMLVNHALAFEDIKPTASKHLSM